MPKGDRKVSPNIFNDNTLDNRNFLAPTGFVMQIAKCPKTTYFCTAANIPAMTLGVANQPTYMKNIPTPGDVIEFEDLGFRALHPMRSERIEAALETAADTEHVDVLLEVTAAGFFHAPLQTHVLDTAVAVGGAER